MRSLLNYSIFSLLPGEPPGYPVTLLSKILAQPVIDLLVPVHRFVRSQNPVVLVREVPVAALDVLPLGAV